MTSEELWFFPYLRVFFQILSSLLLLGFLIFLLKDEYATRPSRRSTLLYVFCSFAISLVGMLALSLRGEKAPLVAMLYVGNGSDDPISVQTSPKSWQTARGEGWSILPIRFSGDADKVKIRFFSVEKKLLFQMDIAGGQHLIKFGKRYHVGMKIAPDTQPSTPPRKMIWLATNTSQEIKGCFQLYGFQGERLTQLESVGAVEEKKHAEELHCHLVMVRDDSDIIYRKKSLYPSSHSTSRSTSQNAVRSTSKASTQKP